MRRIVLSGAALALVIVVLRVAQLPGQSSTPAGGTGAQAEPALKTPWGEPDLQGLWTHDTETPLQRPAAFAGREFLTEEEVTEIDRRRRVQLDHDYRAPRGTPNDVNGAYNAVYHLRKPTGRRSSLIVDPPDGRIPPYTPEALARQAVWREFDLALLQASPACKNQQRGCAGGEYGPPSPRYDEPAPIYPAEEVNRSDGPEDHGIRVRCLGGFLPAGGESAGFSSGGNGFTRRIVQTLGGITMYYDTGQGQGFQRNIVMNGSPHLPPHVRQWWGDSRGHWEGETLVIDVTNFTPKTNIFGGNENVHLVERFTRTGPETLEYIVTIEDPTTWTRPWTVMVEHTKQDEEANRFYIEPRCHEGNYGLSGLLRGARVIDQTYAEGRGPHPATICTSNAACSEKLGAPESETASPFR